MALTKKRLLRFGLVLVLTGVVIFALTPLLVANGLRAWLKWKARQQKLTCDIEKIEAPLLRPVVIHGFHVVSGADAAFRMDVRVKRAVVELNLRSLLLRMRDRAIRTLTIEETQAEFHRQHSGNTITDSGWDSLQKLLPENLALQDCNIRVEDGPTVVLLRDLDLRAGQIEAGPFSVAEVRIDSPLFRQSFRMLQGSSRWQGDRLTAAGLRLSNGLDLQSITADLSQLSQQHAGLEFDVDTFGGKVRANVASDWRGQNATWNVIASATDVSLAQTSQALGFMDRVDGLMHACKFTFRGDPRDIGHATASLWTELTALSWRNRAADVIMLGAALFNRQVQLQQLYVKQKDNQLNLNGELSMPDKAPDWLSSDFHGNVSASIANLGDFASLFGANRGDFTGQMNVEGIMNAGGRKIGGHLTATGKSLSIFKSPVDTFTAKINLKANDLEIEQLDVQRQADLLHLQGKMDLGAERTYSGAGNCTVANVAPYLRLLPASWHNAVTAGAVNCDWSGNGNNKGHAGKFHLTGRNLQAPPGPLGKWLPFNAELDGDYAPGNLFFRQAHLTNEHASLNGFFTVAPKYLQLQAIALDINGKPRLRGNAFLPVSLTKWIGGASLLDSLDQGQKMDADLALDPGDIGEFFSALTGQSKYGGSLDARITLFGNLDALQGWSAVHLRDFAMPEDPARTTADADVKFESGTMNTNATFAFRGTDPLKVESSLPVRLGEQRSKAWTDPFSASFTTAKLSIARLPKILTRDWLRDGVVSAKVTASQTLAHPSLAGDFQLTNGIPGNIPCKANDIAATIAFKGTTATFEPLTFVMKGAGVSLSGDADYTDPNAMKIKLSGIRPLFDMTPAEADNCIQEVSFATRGAGETAGRAVDHVQLNESATDHTWTIELQPANATAEAKPRVFKFCATGDAQKTLVIASEPAAKAAAKPTKKRRR